MKYVIGCGLVLFLSGTLFGMDQQYSGIGNNQGRNQNTFNNNELMSFLFQQFSNTNRPQLPSNSNFSQEYTEIDSTGGIALFSDAFLKNSHCLIKSLTESQLKAFKKALISIRIYRQNNAENQYNNSLEIDWTAVEIFFKDYLQKDILETFTEKIQTKPCEYKDVLESMEPKLLNYYKRGFIEQAEKEVKKPEEKGEYQKLYLEFLQTFSEEVNKDPSQHQELLESIERKLLEYRKENILNLVKEMVHTEGIQHYQTFIEDLTNCRQLGLQEYLKISLMFMKQNPLKALLATLLAIGGVGVIRRI